MPWRLRRLTRASQRRNRIDHLRVEASVLSNGLRNVVVIFVMLGLLATACTEGSRDRIREALPSGVSGLPSVTGLPSPRPTGPTGPTGGGSGETTAPTGPTETGEPTAPTGTTGSAVTPTEEPTEPPTESPAEPTEAPPPEQGRLILAIIAILERLGEQPPPTEQPSPTETPSPEATTGPEGETATGPTGGSTGVTGVVTGPTGATGAADGDASADVVEAAASSSTDSSAWVLILFLAMLGTVIGYLWWRARRGRAHHG
jgi:hypothetical protein